MKHLIGTASAAGVAFGLALFASTAYAQSGTGAGAGTGDGKSGDATATSTTRDSNNSNSQNTTYTVPISNSLNDNSTKNTDKSQHFDQSQHYDQSQHFDQSQRNDNSQNYDQSQKNDNSTGHNDNSQNYYVPVTDSGNTLKDHHDNNSVNGSYNSSLKVGDVSLAMSSEDLKGSVSDQSFNARGAGNGLQSGQLTFSGNAMQGYAGITNASYVTGQGSLGQAANSVTATSSIAFR